MAYEKQTTQRYNMLGGVNQKASDYTTGESQFLRIVNMDGWVPNALTKRPGWSAVAYLGTIGATTGNPITGIYEYTKFSGFSQVMITYNTGMWTWYNGSGTANLFTFTSSGTERWDFVTFNDIMWAADGETFIRYMGVAPSGSTLTIDTLSQYYLPQLYQSSTASGISLVGTGNGFSFGATTLIEYMFTLVRADGTEGPVDGLISTKQLNKGPGSGISAIFMQLAWLGSPTITPVNWGYTAINVYRYEGTQPLTVSPSFDEFHFLTTIPGGASNFLDTAGTTNIVNNPSPQNRFPFGFTLEQTGFLYSAINIPKYLEIFNNCLFMAGFTVSPSRVWYSDVGTPELVEAQNFFDVRTNDNDIVTGMKQYNDQLIITKKNSFHKLIGNDPDNFQLVQVSGEYGCLSNMAIIQAEEMIYFLDKKGVVQYNGSQFPLISTPLEKSFRRMNITAAINNACATYNQFRNQVWFSIPLDSSTTNNYYAVYDLITESWYEYEGLKSSFLTSIQSSFPRAQVWHGAYGGAVGAFSASFFNDNGVGFTTLVVPRFEAPIGLNVEKMFRRHYLDIEPYSGVTGTVQLTAYRNFDDTVPMATFTDFMAPTFQIRHDMGIPGRSFSMQFSHFSASLPIQINGYAITYKFLRNV